MARSPYTNAGRKKENGLLAATKQDLNSHAQGGSLRHEVSHININPVIDGEDNLRTLLESIFSNNSGQGFITIGDGYAGTSTDLAGAFNDAFNNPRLANGGIILVKAGEYVMNTTVTVPNGITIMGEFAGSIIVGEMSETPMFVFQASADIHNVRTSLHPMIQSEDQNRLINIVLYDNINENVASGGPSMSAVPMLQCKRGANLSIDYCTFVGRVDVGPVRATHRVVGFTGSYVSFGTNLSIKNCYIDGVETAVDFDANQGAADELRVEGNRARTFGDGGTGTIEDRYFITTSNCNAFVVDNFHEGLNTTYSANGFIYIKNIAVSDTNTNFIINGNSGEINPGSSSTNNLITDGRAIQNEIKTSGTNTWGFPAANASKSIVNRVQANDEPEVTSGSTTTARGIVHHAFAHRYMQHSSANTQTYSIDPENVAHGPGTDGVGFGFLNIICAQSALTAVTVNIDNTAGSVANGAFFEIVLQNMNGADVTMNWDSEFRFSDPSDAQLGAANMTAGAIVRWRGVSFVDVLNGPAYLMERMDYLP